MAATSPTPTARSLTACDDREPNDREKVLGRWRRHGHTLRRSAAPAIAFTIVGVVGDVRDTALNQESPTLYYPMGLRVWPLMDVVVRTDGQPDALLPSIRQKVNDLDPELALANVQTMQQWLSTAPRNRG